MRSFLFFVCLISATVQAQNYLSPAAFFSKCYAHLTGKKVPPNHPLLVDSIRKNDHRASLDNCMKVFDKARLKPFDQVPIASTYARVSNLENLEDMESVAVLNYFFSLYNNFFEEKNFDNLTTFVENKPHVFMDVSEDALYFLKATFQGHPAASNQQYQEQIDFQSVVTSSESLMGRRVIPQKNAHRVDKCNNFVDLCGFHPLSPNPNWIVGRIPWSTLPDWDWRNGLGSTPGLGYLVGIKTWSKDHESLYTLNGRSVSPGSTAADNFTFGFNIPRSHGGGLLGSSSYILKNIQYIEQTDGAVKNRRRAVKNAFSALLCRDMPPLRMDSSTVLQKVSEYKNHGFSASSKLAFRESATCASCHVSYDGAAAVYRNTLTFQAYNSNIDFNSDGTTRDGYSMDIYRLLGSLSANSSTVVPSFNLVNGTADVADLPNGIYQKNAYSSSKPSGLLAFHDWRGQLNEYTLNASASGMPAEDAGIQQLGEAIAETDQLYVCFAKRLFAHFTGINISLEDHSDSRLPPLPTSDLHYRDRYIVPLALGNSSGAQGLKDHKSIRRLIYNILSSDLYRSQSMRDYNP